MNERIPDLHIADALTAIENHALALICAIRGAESYQPGGEMEAVVWLADDLHRSVASLTRRFDDERAHRRADESSHRRA